MTSTILLATIGALGLAFGGLALASDGVVAPRTVAIPTEDGVPINGIVYGQSPRAVVLVHGSQYRKESWDSQARSLAEAGVMAIAIDLLGFGGSTGPGQVRIPAKLTGSSGGT